MQDPDKPIIWIEVARFVGDKTPKECKEKYYEAVNTPSMLSISV